MTRTLADPGRDAPAWFLRLWNDARDAITTLLWADVDKTGSALTDIETRPHSALQGIGEADSASSDATKDKHVSNAQMKAAADHIAATNAHGATGDLIGAGDLATTGAAGVIVQGAAVADLGQTISVMPNQAEVQAISDKIDELLASLRAGAIDT